MSPDRSFYGGDPPGQVGHGEIEGGTYTGPKLYPENAPWVCPACRADQTGPLAEGCQACGAGTVKARRIDPPIVDMAVDVAKRSMARQAAIDAPVSIEQSIYQYALNWSAANPDATPADAFMAGYKYAIGRTIGAPPVAVDVERLAPEGKPRRTIAAALRYFRDQVLAEATEEIAAGEWCSIEEVDRLIQQFEEDV